MATWNDEPGGNVEILKKLWADGLSASQIAAQLGGFTRNAVIGKVHRLSLSGRAKPTSSNPRPRRTRAASPHRPARHFIAGNSALKTHAHPAPRRLPPPIAIEDIIVPISLNVTLLGLTDAMCKWPIGDPSADGFHFCGHKHWHGLPYCEYHSRVAYQPVDRRRSRHNTDYSDWSPMTPTVGGKVDPALASIY